MARTNKSQAAPTELPPELSDSEISKMDGAGASDTNVITYPTSMEVIGQLDYALRFLNAKFYHTSVNVVDFLISAYEQPRKGSVPLGRPEYLAFQHKKTGKSAAGYAYNDPPRPFSHYSTASDMISILAKEDEQQS